MVRLGALLAAGLFATASLSSTAAPVYNFQLKGDDAKAAETAQPASPHSIVTDGVDALRAFVNSGGAQSPADIEAFLDKAIAPNFDFETMARWSAGPFYRRLDAEQRDRFHEKIQSMFLGSLARNLGSYALALPRVQVYPAATLRWGDEMSVRARVVPQNGYPVTLDFRFYRRDDGWRIFDVAANGFSAVSFYRRHFAEQVRARGMSALHR